MYTLFTMPWKQSIAHLVILWTLQLLPLYDMCGQRFDLRTCMHYTCTRSLSLPDVTSLVLASLVSLSCIAAALLAAIMNQCKLTGMLVHQLGGHWVGKKGQQTLGEYSLQCRLFRSSTACVYGLMQALLCCIWELSILKAAKPTL